MTTSRSGSCRLCTLCRWEMVDNSNMPHPKCLGSQKNPGTEPKTCEKEPKLGFEYLPTSKTLHCVRTACMAFPGSLVRPGAQIVALHVHCARTALKAPPVAPTPQERGPALKVVCPPSSSLWSLLHLCVVGSAAGPPLFVPHQEQQKTDKMTAANKEGLRSATVHFYHPPVRAIPY